MRRAVVETVDAVVCDTANHCLGLHAELAVKKGSRFGIGPTSAPLMDTTSALAGASLYWIPMALTGYATTYLIVAGHRGRRYPKGLDTEQFGHNDTRTSAGAVRFGYILWQMDGPLYSRSMSHGRDP